MSFKADYKNNVFLGYKLLLLADPVTVALDVFREVTPEDMPTFMLMISDKKVAYVDSFKSFFDVGAKLADFAQSDDLAANAKMNTDVQLGLTDDELNYAIEWRKAEAKKDALVQSIDAKFKARFARPVIPYEVSTSMDVEKVFGKLADEAMKWINEPKYVASHDLAIYVGAKPEERNLLRKKGSRIQNLTNHVATEKQFAELAQHAMKIWADPAWMPKKTNSHWNEDDNKGSLGDHRSMTVAGYTGRLLTFPTYLKLQCQRVPRSEIERMATLEGVTIDPKST